VTLPQPATAAGREGLRALLVDPADSLVALDFDGTLSPIVPDPDDARAHPDVPPVLERLAERGVRVAVVTGRPAQLAVDNGGLAGVSGLVVLGHYGLERWESGTVTAPDAAAGVAVARDRLPGLLRELGAPEGTAVEDKGRAVAVHTRRAPDPQATLEALRAPLQGLAEETGLVVEPGRLVLELRPAGADKGAAIRGLVEERPPSALVFVGDDLGDLPAYDEVEHQRRLGLPGLLVGSGSTEVTAVAERADLVVDGPEGVAALLGALAAELGG
jgi:trehalose 6-phosphate phosphatase